MKDKEMRTDKKGGVAMETWASKTTKTMAEKIINDKVKSHSLLISVFLNNTEIQVAGLAVLL